MARSEELTPGNCYFNVGYFDENLLLPSIHTLIYLHPEKSDDGRDLWIFEEPQSAPAPHDAVEAAEPPVLIAFDEENLYGILDFPGLLRVLNQVAGYHPLTPEKPVTTSAISQTVIEDLERHIEKFLLNPDHYAVTITIRFTDDGLSLGRRKDGGFKMGFYAHPRLDPEEEIKILAVFARLGVNPHVDYLSDKGRTRVLHFAIPEDVKSIVELCAQVFVEVYAIRPTDALQYSFLPHHRIEEH